MEALRGPQDPPVLTPKQFHTLLNQLILRMKNDADWQKLSFFNRHQFQLLDDQFARMMERALGRDIRKD